MSKCFGQPESLVCNDQENGDRVNRSNSNSWLSCVRSGQISPLPYQENGNTSIKQDANTTDIGVSPSIERRPIVTQVNGVVRRNSSQLKINNNNNEDVEETSLIDALERGDLQSRKDYSHHRKPSTAYGGDEEDDHFDQVDQEITPLGRILRPRNTKDPSGRLNSIFIPPSKPSMFCFPQMPKKQGGTIAPRIKAWLEPTDSPINVKLFGSKQAVKQEQIRTRMSGWVVHPCSTLRHYWDVVMLLILVSNIIVLPVAITFIDEDQAPFWMGFNIVSDVTFVIDIALNFRTGFMVHNSYNQFILEPKLIVRRYLKTWFILDFISSLPFDYIVATLRNNSYGIGLTSASRALKFLRLAKLLSLLRLLRVTRLLRSISQYEELFHITTSFVRYIKLVSMMFLVAHWNGCLAFLVPLLQDFPADSWVAINELRYADWTTQYSWALFKALSHMLCIGYGRFPPANLSEAYITIFSMITGATFYALFIAHSMSFMQQLDSARRMYMEKFKQIEEYMSYRKLPGEIREKLSEYYEHRYQGKLFDEEEILDEISKPLRELIVSHNCRDLIDSVPFFRNGSPQFVATILTKLTFEVYLPGDYVITEGAFGTEMFFIRQGLVDIIVNDECVTTLSEGAYFGEICLLTNARRVASVRAVTVCDLFVLSAECFNAVLEEFPEMKVIIEHVAVERLQKIGRSVPALEDSEPSSPKITQQPHSRDATNQANSHLMLADMNELMAENNQGQGNGSVARMEDKKKPIKDWKRYGMFDRAYDYSKAESELQGLNNPEWFSILVSLGVIRGLGDIKEAHDGK